MSKIKISGNASGTGVVTLTAPNTNTDRTITLPDGDITLGVGIDDNATSTAITIDASENVTVNTGNLVIGTSGKGIDFSADGNAAGMTSELLDDYEEGTFTPNITGLTTTGTWASTITAGYYTKIGNRVFLHGSFYGTGGTGTGALLLSGLPFASAHGGYTSGGIQVNDSLTFPTGTITTPWYGWDATHFAMRCSKSNAAFSYLQIPSAVNYIRFDINYLT